jgi:hypothetical protein
MGFPTASRRRAVLVSGLLLPLVALAGCIAWTMPRAHHEERVVDVEPSPDGALQARLVEVWNSNGWFNTSVVDGVDITAAREPGETARLMWMDLAGNSDFRPRLTWTAPDVLQVTVPNLSVIVVKLLAFEGARLDLRFDPADPAARANWLDQHFPRRRGVAQ